MIKIAKDKKLKKVLLEENRKTAEKQTHERQSQSLLSKEFDENTIKTDQDSNSKTIAHLPKRTAKSEIRNYTLH